MDFHKELASRYYKIPLDQVTIEQRKLAKRALFVYLYNGQEYTIEELMALGLPVMKALEAADKETPDDNE